MTWQDPGPEWVPLETKRGRTTLHVFRQGKGTPLAESTLCGHYTKKNAVIGTRNFRPKCKVCERVRGEV